MTVNRLFVALPPTTSVIDGISIKHYGSRSNAHAKNHRIATVAVAGHGLSTTPAVAVLSLLLRQA